MRMEGLEPSTSRLWDLRSNQLSYIRYQNLFLNLFKNQNYKPMFTKYVMNKGIKSLETELEDKEDS